MLRQEVQMAHRRHRSLVLLVLAGEREEQGVGEQGVLSR